MLATYLYDSFGQSYEPKDKLKVLPVMRALECTQLGRNTPRPAICVLINLKGL